MVTRHSLCICAMYIISIVWMYVYIKPHEQWFVFRSNSASPEISSDFGTRRYSAVLSGACYLSPL